MSCCSYLPIPLTLASGLCRQIQGSPHSAYVGEVEEMMCVGITEVA